MSVQNRPLITRVPPAIPLTPEVRQAYQDLYNKMQDAIQGTTNVAMLEALNTWQGEVDDVLTKDNMYRLRASSALFDALQKQIDDTNDGLEKLRDQIESISAGFQEGAKVLDAINQVLSLIPGV